MWGDRVLPSFAPTRAAFSACFLSLLSKPCLPPPGPSLNVSSARKSSRFPLAELLPSSKGTRDVMPPERWSSSTVITYPSSRFPWELQSRVQALRPPCLASAEAGSGWVPRRSKQSPEPVTCVLGGAPRPPGPRGPPHVPLRTLTTSVTDPQPTHLCSGCPSPAHSAPSLA